MDEQQIKASFQLAANETIPPMALGHIAELWFLKGVAAALAAKSSCSECGGTGAMETGIGIMVCDSCGGH